MTTKKCNELCEELGFEMESIKEDDGTFHIVRKGEVMLTKQQYIKDVYNFLVSLKEKMDQNPDFDVVGYLVGDEVDQQTEITEENEPERESEQELEDKERDSGSGESEKEIEEPDPGEQVTGEESGEVEEMIEREKSIFFEEEE